MKKGENTGIANSVINYKRINQNQMSNNGTIKKYLESGLFMNPYKYDGGCTKSAIEKS